MADRILAASGLDTRTHGNAALTEVSDAWGSSNKKEGVNWKVRVIKDDSTKNASVWLAPVPGLLRLTQMYLQLALCFLMARSLSS